jgi:integrase
MPRGRITKRAVDALACPAGKDREFLWDTALAGFGVAAFASGKKVYVCQYRQGGRSRRIAVGEHGRLTPDEARSEAKKLLGLAEAGIDPVAEKRKERELRTFGAVAADFLTSHVTTKRKGRTADEYRRILGSRILPALGSKRIIELRRADVARLHGKLADKPYEANRAVALISAVWNWAAKRGEVALADNPAKGIERYREHKRERYLTSDELGRLGDALRQGETEGLPYSVDEANPKSKHAPKAENRRVQFDPFAAAAIRLLILTGARLREILHAKWEHVDFERGLTFLPDSKTGKKTLYLSAAALDVLANLPRIEGNPFIIPGAENGKPRADLKRPWEGVRRAAGLKGVRLHDLRHSFASVGAGASLGLPIIGKLLGHSQAATTHRYAHLDADPMRRAADAIGATIAAAMSGKSGARALPFRRSTG